MSCEIQGIISLLTVLVLVAFGQTLAAFAVGSGWILAYVLVLAEQIRAGKRSR